MATAYDPQLQNLLEELRPISLQTVVKLEQIVADYGARAAFYAAFVIVCLEARVQERGYQAVSDVTTQDLSNFTYFEYTKQNPQAQACFTDMLETYKTDCKRRFAKGVSTASV